eukprot:gene23722-13345_t
MVRAANAPAAALARLLLLLLFRPPAVCFGCSSLTGEELAQCRQQKPCEACHYASRLGGTKKNPINVPGWSDNCWCCSNTGSGIHAVGCDTSECQANGSCSDEETALAYNFENRPPCPSGSYATVPTDISWGECSTTTTITTTTTTTTTPTTVSTTRTTTTPTTVSTTRTTFTATSTTSTISTTTVTTTTTITATTSTTTLNATQLVAQNITASLLKEQQNMTAAELLSKGFLPKTLVGVGYTDSELREAGLDEQIIAAAIMPANQPGSDGGDGGRSTGTGDADVDPTPATDPSSSGGAAAGIVIDVLVFIITSVVGVLYWRRNENLCSQTGAAAAATAQRNERAQQPEAQPYGDPGGNQMLYLANSSAASPYSTPSGRTVTYA